MSEHRNGGTGPSVGVPSRYRWWGVVVDVLLVVVVLVFEAGPIISGAPPWSHRPFGALDALRLAGFTAPLLLRRRYPIPVLVVVVASFWDSALLGAGLMVAFYSVGAWSRDRRVSLVALGLGSAGGVAEFVAHRNVGGVEAAAVIAFFGVAWFLGDISRVRRQYTALLEERAERLEAERETELRLAAAAERAAIARELHDIVAHRVSMITVQAGAAGVVAESDPAAVRRAIGAIEDAGRLTLEELRRLVGVLRSDEVGEHILDTPPTLNELPELVRDVESSGVPVRFTELGERPQVSACVEMCTYRIVQEALTNVIKHAGEGAEADVVLRYTPDEIQIEVSDTGRGAVGAIPGGHGLVGMRERAAVYGGTVQAGPRPEGGFTVRARMQVPIDP